MKIIKWINASFNAEYYEKLNNSRGKVVAQINKYGLFHQVLDVGCGDGNFSNALAKQFKHSNIKGIDIVPSYIDAAIQKYRKDNLTFKVGNFYDEKQKYDLITLFLAMTELLKTKKIENILKKLSDRLNDEGIIVIVDEFEDDYTNSDDITGLKVNKSLGYKYLNSQEFIKGCQKNNLKVLETEVLVTNTKKMNIKKTSEYIRYENQLNIIDKTVKKTNLELWHENKQAIVDNNGIRVNHKLRYYILKKYSSVEKKLVSLRKTPTLLFDLKAVQNKINLYQMLEKKYDMKFIFPVKCFPHSKIIAFFAKNNFGFDFSNYGEYKKIEKFLKKDSILSTTGPLAVENINNYANVMVNANSKNQWLSDNGNCQKGIRINFNNVKGFEFSHFGITDYKKLPAELVQGVHFHIVDGNKKNLEDQLINEIVKIQDYFINLQYLNIGGGWHDYSFLEFERFVKKLRQLLKRNIIIYAEPGDMWFVDTGYLVTRVVDKKTIDNKSFVYLNISREVHTKWSDLKLVEFKKNEQVLDQTTIFCGGSCYEKDIIMLKKEKLNYDVGDIVIFSNVSCYSYAWGKEFNGIDIAELKFYE